jgi:membrane-bound lytic murein transglycosylase B
MILRLTSPILLLLIAACIPTPEVNTKSPAQPAESPQVAALVKNASSVSDSVPVTTQPTSTNFDRWLEQLATEARAQGISETTLEDALTGLKPIPQAAKAAKTQAEMVFTTSRYLERMVSQDRVRKGALQMREKRALFERISEVYGVQPQYLAALWGVESDFGRDKGRFPIIGALATQAWDGRRQDFFRRELLAALTILDEEQMKSADLRGSWAGASGQFQFIPTTYLHYAVDFNEDGKRDIWHNPEDALASAANFLAKARWKPGQEWGRPIHLPNGFDVTLGGLDTRKPLKEWRRLGIAEAGGPDDLPASLLLPDGPEGPAFLVFDNFQVLRRWNRSSSFALAIGHLADRIKTEIQLQAAKDEQ